jgi:hypothetical protein
MFHQRAAFSRGMQKKKWMWKFRSAYLDVLNELWMDHFH